MKLDALSRELHRVQRASTARMAREPPMRRPDLGDAADLDVSRVVSDSRQAVPGSVFVALRGAHADGASFARDALDRGVDRGRVRSGGACRHHACPWMQVADARQALAVLAAAFERHPSEELTLVGITGTNGKTTTSYLLASIFEAAGVRCGRIGTVGYRIGDREIEARSQRRRRRRSIQRMLREMVDRGLRRVRDGSVVARARAAARRPAALRRRRSSPT